MASFIALYRGESVATAELLVVTSDPTIVRDFADRMLDEPPPPTADPAVAAKHEGRRRGLEVVRDEAEDRADGD